MNKIINIFLKLFSLELNDIKDTSYKPYNVDVDVDRYIAILIYESEVCEDQEGIDMDTNITAIQESLNYISKESEKKQLEVMDYFNKLSLWLKNWGVYD